MIEVLFVILVGAALAEIWRRASASSSLGTHPEDGTNEAPESTELNEELKILLENNSKRSGSWAGFAQNFGFFLAGAVVSLFASEIRGFLNSIF